MRPVENTRSGRTVPRPVLPLSRTENSSTAAVGRIGRLDLEYALRDGRTQLLRSSCTTPWHYLPPIELDGTRGAYTLLVNPSGGVVGGDHLTIRATIGSGAHALFSTPSANRIYRSSAGVARQAVQIEVGPEAIVEWVPEAAIPYAGSRYSQQFEVSVAQGAVLWLWETLASGRMARGERWAFTEFSSAIRIETANGARLVERMGVEPGQAGHGIGLAGDWDYVTSAFLVSDRTTEAELNMMADDVAAAIESLGAEVLGGVSRPAASGLAIKLVAKTGDSSREALDRMWGVVRRRLWGEAIPALRKY